MSVAPTSRILTVILPRQRDTESATSRFAPRPDSPPIPPIPMGEAAAHPHKKPAPRRARPSTIMTRATVNPASRRSLRGSPGFSRTHHLRGEAQSDDEQEDAQQQG